MMKGFLLIVSQILLLSVMHAQVFQIQWDSQLSAQSVGGVNYFVPNISNETSYHDGANLPHFYKNEVVSANAKLDLNILTEKNVAVSQLGDVKPEDIPNEPTFDVGVYKSRNTYYQVIDVTGFYREKSTIKQILSFEITASNRSNQRTSNTRQVITPVLDRANGQFYKISVDTTGVFKIDRQFLRTNNLPTTFDPALFKIYGNGGMMLPERPGAFRYNELQEVAIQAVGVEDGSFDEGDYFLFYAQGPHGIVRQPLLPGDKVGDHSKNLYEEKAYYFINFEGSTGKRIQEQVAIPANPVQVFNDFDQVLFYENDSLNLYNIGRLWVGEAFYEEPSFQVQFAGIGSVSNPTLSYQMAGTNAAGVSFDMVVNGEQAAQGAFAGGELKLNAGTQNISNTSYPLTIQVNVNNVNNPAAGVYLDYLRLNFTQDLTFNDSQLGFRWLQGINRDSNYGFILNGNPEFVWDVSDRINAEQMIAQSGNRYAFRAKSNATLEDGRPYYPNEFIAFNANQAMIPDFVGSVPNQSLASLSGIDYVIVTHPDFISQAQRLANAHERRSNIKAAVVTTEQIYNEFSSGSQDIAAIRDFFKFLYEDNPNFGHALLLGDTSYDFKDRIPNNENYVPSYQSKASVGLSSTFVTDDFFGIVGETDSGLNLSQLDIAVGRLPARSVNEAELLIGKTLSYINSNSSYGSPFGDWRTKITLLVDDDNPGPGNAFHHTVEANTAQWLARERPFYTIEKLYADAFEQVGTSGGNRFPVLERTLVNSVESGTVLFNYFGHGGVNGLAQERIFTQNHVQELTNYNREYARLPIMLTITCEFTVWDVPQLTSAGELMLKNPEGGAVAMLTTSRKLSVFYGLSMNHVVVENLFQQQGDKYISIGEAMRQSKVANGGSQALKINLLGDPLISLPRPNRKVNIDKINGQDANLFDGTISALDFVTIEGSVLRDNDNMVDTSFNGKVAGTLFDKVEEKTTLNNDGNIDVLTYEEQTNAVYKGSSTIENGEFTFEFYVPKDINYDVGDSGKLLLYVENGREDGVTFKNDIKIGGLNENSEVLDDDEGPVVGLYMNNLNFANGGITDRSPYLLACVTDSTGINATGSGIGHDITQLLDANINSTTVLNDFFEGGDASPCLNPNVKDFQKGRVLYKLNDLDLGEHSITFRVWDINNNSTTESLDFMVMEDGEQQLHINRLLNWPNPFTTQTYFHFEHNCPDILEVQVQVFSVAGKLVKTIRQTVTSAPFREGYRTDKFAIPWDGLDDYGNKIGKGVYIYRTTVRGANGESCKGQVSATEKLVILK
ncbi:type IX secretion system sortase PorU [Flavobacteriaceae bacterium Ap0902]|nr:type IX secretion system sortase PorU [Flavobacteriaceae bacterium Ap0902]